MGTFNFRELLEGQVRARARHGVVSLSGFVRGESERRVAIETAKSFPRVMRVADALVVRHCEEGEEGSGWVARIRCRLLAKANVSVKGLRIEERAGAIYLGGVVDNPVRRALVEALARAVAGEVSIRNELGVDPSQLGDQGELEVDDMSVSGSVRAALQELGIAAKVETRAGFVALWGVATDNAEREAAGAVAQSFRGVKWVSNGMAVRQSDGPRLGN